MDFTGVIIATLLIGGVGLFVGIFLGIAGLKFQVEVDKKEEKVLEVLPGNNCGACGYPGCSGLAAAIAKGEAPADTCPVGGPAVAKKVADIMGVEVTTGKKMVAFVKCQANYDKVTFDYEYTGIMDCAMMKFVPNGGPKACKYGCLGYGSCVKVCPFDAIHVIDGVAVVDKDACKACGKCIMKCPKNLIEMIPYEAEYVVACSNHDKGAVTTKACQVGCIGCSLCVKQCESDAITIHEFNAYIDQEKCTQCGKCITVCPKKSIIKIEKEG